MDRGSRHSPGILDRLEWSHRVFGESCFMPFTLAHPAVVVPLARLGPRVLVLSALVVGSMAPDFEYFVYLRPIRTIGHDFQGIWLQCVPAGLVCLAVFDLVLKHPLMQLLPDSIRLRLLPFETPTPLWPIASLLRIVLSIALGAFTHIAWDAFTHENGWVVCRVQFLSRTVLEHNGQPLKVYKLLQYVSTVVGLACLAAWSCRWVGRQPRMANSGAVGMAPRNRNAVCAVLLVVPVWFGSTRALQASNDGLYRMAGHFVVSTITAVTALVLVYGVLYRFLAHKPS